MGNSNTDARRSEEVWTPLEEVFSRYDYMHPTEPRRMRVVAQCQAGLVRSGALKFLLTYAYRCEVMACGWESNTEELRRILYEWADLIVVVEEKRLDKVPLEYRGKTVIIEIGPDIYLNPFNPDLLEKTARLIAESGLFGEERRCVGQGCNNAGHNYA